jgi:hypothetical protein
MVVTNIVKYVRISFNTRESFSTKFSTWKLKFVTEVLLSMQYNVLQIRPLRFVNGIKNKLEMSLFL